MSETGESTPPWPRLPHVLRRRDGELRLLAAIRELHAFAWHEGWSCLFAVTVFAALGLTQAVRVPGLPRYDLMLLICVATQALLLLTRWETRDEFKVICMFHAIGVGLEWFKVSHGSWVYPEDAYSKICGVPLYAGFMYASVASFMCQAWRRHDLRYPGWPPAWQCFLLIVVIYGNFFTNRWLPDARWLIFAAVLVVFRRTRVTFVNNGPRRWMPLVCAFALIAFFVWMAENIASFLNAYRYPHQHVGWKAVPWQKWTSWNLLVIVSLVLIAQLKSLKHRRDQISNPNPA